jgi:hypothetical protein
METQKITIEVGEISKRSSRTEYLQWSHKRIRIHHHKVSMYKTRLHHLYLMLPNAVGLFAFVFLFSLVGCAKNVTPPEGPKFTSTPEAGMTESAPHVSPYIKVMVVDVIRGTLPDQCKYDFYSLENRGNLNVKISLSGIHPADNSCLQTDQTIEYVLRLGRDMPESERGFAPGNYELIVNNYQTSFSIK